MSKLTLQSTLTIEYETGGVPAAELKGRLEDAVQYLFGEAMITGATDATVSRWRHEVAEIHDPLPLVTEAKILGLTEEDMDELVLDQESADGSNTNNLGLTGQIEYLLEHMGPEEVLSLLREAAQEKNPG